MEPEVNEIPTRRAWAPFVGAALAMLTTGSLVVFALIAERTSLDGFSNDRVAAARPAGTAPSAITIAPVGGSAPSSGASDDGSPAADGAASPGVPVAVSDFFEIVTTSTPLSRDRDTVAFARGSDDAEENTRTEETVDGPTLRLAALDDPNQHRAELFAMGGGGGSSDGELVGSDDRHDGKHSHKSHAAIDKGRKSKKAKRQGSKAHTSSARRHTSSGYTSSSASRPAQPVARSSNGKQHPAPPSHSNAGGNGKSRGRGHGRR